MWNLDLEIETVFKEKIKQARDISVAIENAFNYKTDKVIITVDEIDLFIPLPYLFSDLLTDFLLIINDLLDLEQGEGVYGFSQNVVFDADFKLVWTQENIDLTIEWREIDCHKPDIPFSNVSINKASFLTSWKKLFTLLSEYIDFKSIILESHCENDIINKLLNKQL